MFKVMFCSSNGGMICRYEQQLRQFADKAGYQISVMKGQTRRECLGQYDDPDEIDLFIIDCRLDQNHGMEMAQHLRNVCARSGILFLTSRGMIRKDRLFHYINLACALGAAGFLEEKEQDDQEFRIALQCAFRRMIEHKKQQLCIIQDRVPCILDIGDINYCQEQGHMITIYCDHGQFHTYQSLTAFKKSLKEREFVQVSRNYLVPLDNIRSIEKTELFLNHPENVRIPLGTAFGPSLRGRLKSLRLMDYKKLIYE